jgi:hypothetical protein
MLKRMIQYSNQITIAWTAANKPAEIHIHQQGGHGFGTRPRNQPVDAWLDRFGEWLRSQKLARGNSAR